MINCEIEHDLSWSGDCVSSEISRTPGVPANSAANDSVPPTKTIGATFQVNSTKFNVPVIPLSLNDTIKIVKT